VSHEQLADEIHQRLGRRHLNRGWAKAEILLGLAAAGIGLMLGEYAITRSEPEWRFAAAGLGLFVLGGYLALAGHRSHLYQSANEQAALLIDELRQQRR
jgi:hypothetical protein